MIRKLLLFTFVIFFSHISCDADEAVSHRLVQNRRSFLKHVDEDKLESYLSSFGASPTPAETERHEVFKRASSPRKMKRTKKVSTTTTAAPSEVEIPTKPLNNGKNFSVSPRHIMKFELDDAKYSEEYEKLQRSRKLRVKRSSDFGGKSNGTKTEKFITKDTFKQPREFFKFSYLDAVTKPTLMDATETKEHKESNEKNKREISDSSSTDTKKIHVSHPMRGQRSTKHVSYDEIPAKLQKMIDNALHDAVSKGKASEGDYLRFFYGDKIIKVPVSMSKYIATKTKDTPVYGKKVTFQQEEPKSEPLQLLTTKNAYYPLINHSIKFDAKPQFLPTIPPTSDKAESYMNFETPIVAQDSSDNNYLPYKKSVYFFASNDDKNNHFPKNSMSSPGPVVFEDFIPTTPSSIDASKSHQYSNYIHHPPTKVSIIKDEIPITEHVNEGYSEYIPALPERHRAPIPTSYVEYAGNHADSHDSNKNYEFGYHISDYKTGNNYGHTQKKTKEETKGEYSILLPDGRVQIVKYYANDSGFHADVTYQNVH